MSINKKYDDKTPMDLKEFCEWMSKSKQDHLHIIAMYANQKNLTFSTKGQWVAFLDRNFRAARKLTPYTDEQLAKAYKKMKDTMRDDFKHWTLETLGKFLDA